MKFSIKSAHSLSPSIESDETLATGQAAVLPVSHTTSGFNPPQDDTSTSRKSRDIVGVFVVAFDNKEGIILI